MIHVQPDETCTLCTLEVDPLNSCSLLYKIVGNFLRFEELHWRIVPFWLDRVARLWMLAGCFCLFTLLNPNLPARAMSKKTTGLVASDGVIASVMVDNCWVLRNSSEVSNIKKGKKRVGGGFPCRLFNSILTFTLCSTLHYTTLYNLHSTHYHTHILLFSVIIIIIIIINDLSLYSPALPPFQLPLPRRFAQSQPRSRDLSLRPQTSPAFFLLSSFSLNELHSWPKKKRKRECLGAVIASSFCFF